MKIVLNNNYGDFGVSEAFAETWNKMYPDDKIDIIKNFLGTRWYTYVGDCEDRRADPLFVQLVEQMGSKDASGDCACLSVEEIPDEATDWNVINSEGCETLYYVLDGKIHTVGGCAGPSAKDIPDKATDWIITDYDGPVIIHYVLDGKIHTV